MAGLVLIAIGCVLPFFGLSRFFKTFKLRYLILPIPFLAIGMGLIDWRALLLMGAFFACFCLFIYGFHIREELYAKNFPVFRAAPVGSVTRKDGFKHDLHIVKIKTGFIIGINYETEVDLTPMTIQTRWKDVFPDYASARRELLKRLHEFIPADQMPHPSDELP